MRSLWMVGVVLVAGFSLSYAESSAKNGKSAAAAPGAVVQTDKNGNTTVNIGSNNQVANESGNVDGKKWTNSKKVDGPKNDADEAFWGKGGFWGNGDKAP